MAGLFFCLAPDTMQGFYFCLAAMQSHTSVYSAFCAVNELYRPRYKIAHRALLWLFRLFALFYTYYLAVHPAMLYSLQGSGRHTSAQNAYINTRYTLHAGRCIGQHSRPIIIRYIRAAVCPCYESMPDSAANRRPCQSGGVSSYRLRIADK